MSTNLPQTATNNPLAPEIYASGITGLTQQAGNISITLDSVRTNHSQLPAVFERVVVARLVMSTGCAQALVTLLNDFLEKQGASPSDALAHGATKQ